MRPVPMPPLAQPSTRRPAEDEPPRPRGVTVAERCARAVVEPCGACGRDTCRRCEVAAELRAADLRIAALETTQKR